MFNLFLLVVVCVMVGVHIGRFFPHLRTRHNIEKEAIRKERKDKARELCGEWTCVEVNPGLNLGPMGMGDAPYLVLEREGSNILVIQDTSNRAISPGQAVRVRFCDESVISEPFRSYTGIYGEFLEAIPVASQ